MEQDHQDQERRIRATWETVEGGAALREKLRNIIEQPGVQRGIIGLILLNAVLLGLETSPSVMAMAGDSILLLDQLILAVFVIEIAARLYVHRSAFWRDPWSLFDFAVVAIALIPASGPFAVLRALRVLRVLRLLTMVPSMRRVVLTIAHTRHNPLRPTRQRRMEDPEYFGE
jgi:hypothetical protein